MNRGKTHFSGVKHMIGRWLGGEELFMDRYTVNEDVITDPEAAPSDATAVTFASSFPGDMMALELTPGESWTLSRGAYVAGSPNVTVSGKLNWRGALEVGQEEGAVLTKITCEGDGAPGVAFIASYGRFHLHDLQVGQTLLIDNGLFLACPEAVQYEIVQMGRTLLSTVLGGEGLGMAFTGPCRVYTQSHNFNDLAAEVLARMPPSSGGGTSIISSGDDASSGDMGVGMDMGLGLGGGKSGGGARTKTARTMTMTRQKTPAKQKTDGGQKKKMTTNRTGARAI